MGELWGEPTLFVRGGFPRCQLIELAQSGEQIPSGLSFSEIFEKRKGEKRKESCPKAPSELSFVVPCTLPSGHRWIAGTDQQNKSDVPNAAEGGGGYSGIDEHEWESLRVK
jgi:hypothetical protein